MLIEICQILHFFVSVHIHSLARVDLSIKFYEGNVVNILPTSTYLVFDHLRNAE